MGGLNAGQMLARRAECWGADRQSMDSEATIGLPFLPVAQIRVCMGGLTAWKMIARSAECLGNASQTMDSEATIGLPEHTDFTDH